MQQNENIKQAKALLIAVGNVVPVYLTRTPTGKRLVQPPHSSKIILEATPSPQLAESSKPGSTEAMI